MALVFFRGLAWRCARDAYQDPPATAAGPRLLLLLRRRAHSSPRTPLLPLQVHGGAVSTLIIECLIAVFAMKKTQTLLDGALIFSLFPLSIAFIAGLGAFGFD